MSNIQPGRLLLTTIGIYIIFLNPFQIIKHTIALIIVYYKAYVYIYAQAIHSFSIAYLKQQSSITKTRTLALYEIFILLYSVILLLVLNFVESQQRYLVPLESFG